MDVPPIKPELTASDDQLARIALFIGPVLIGSFFGQVLFRGICQGRWILAGEASPFAVFGFFGLLLVVRLKDPVLRVGILVFSIWQAVLFVAWMMADRLPPAASMMNIVCGGLLIAAGLRSAARHKAAIVVAIFVAMLLFSFTSRRFGDSVLGRDTVFRTSMFCSSNAS